MNENPIFDQMCGDYFRKTGQRYENLTASGPVMLRPVKDEIVEQVHEKLYRKDIITREEIEEALGLKLVPEPIKVRPLYEALTSTEDTKNPIEDEAPIWNYANVPFHERWLKKEPHPEQIAAYEKSREYQRKMIETIFNPESDGELEHVHRVSGNVVEFKTRKKPANLRGVREPHMLTLDNDWELETKVLTDLFLEGVDRGPEFNPEGTKVRVVVPAVGLRKLYETGDLYAFYREWRNEAWRKFGEEAPGGDFYSVEFQRHGDGIHNDNIIAILEGVIPNEEKSYTSETPKSFLDAAVSKALEVKMPTEAAMVTDIGKKVRELLERDPSRSIDPIESFEKTSFAKVAPLEDEDSALDVVTMVTTQAIEELKASNPGTVVTDVVVEKEEDGTARIFVTGLTPKDEKDSAVLQELVNRVSENPEMRDILVPRQPAEYVEKATAPDRQGWLAAHVQNTIAFVKETERLEVQRFADGLPKLGTPIEETE